MCRTLFRKSKSILILGCLIYSTSTAFISLRADDLNDGDRDSKVAWGQASKEYVIRLNTAREPESDLDSILQTAKANLQTQSELFGSIQDLDPNATVLSRVRLAGNHIVIRAKESAIEKIKTDERVEHIYIAGSSSASHRIDDKPAQSLQVSPKHKMRAASTAEKSDGDVKVAVIGTGIDYTHSLLGGSGERDSYEEAVNNSSNSYEGFPTDVVVAGRDFSSELGFGQDENPIDSDLRHANYPTGLGTMLAGIIHAAAPEAKLIALKTSNISTSPRGGVSYRLQDVTSLEAAVEWLLDPDDDLSTSDVAANIVVVESSGSGMGLYNPHSQVPDPLIIPQRLYQVLAGYGVLVVTDTGSSPLGTTKYNLSYDSVSPNVLSVNSVKETETGVWSTDTFTAHGPVRMNEEIIKPELSSLRKDTVPVVGSGDGALENERASFAAAKVAAQAALLMQSRPELSAAEVKALLMNTASQEIVIDESNSPAELTFIGSGAVDLQAAIDSPAVVWDSSTYQAGLNFGNHEVSANTNFVKSITVKNLGDTALAYSLEVKSDLNQGARHDAIAWEFPSTVHVPAHKSVTIPIKLNVEISKLGNWPMKSTSSYTIENWRETELSGYVALSSEGLPELSIGWLTKLRPKSEITKHYETLRESFTDGPSLGQFPNGANHKYQEFTNDSTTASQYFALPVVERVETFPATSENVFGARLKMLGSALVAENECTSGQKLVFGAHFQDPIDTAYANYVDRGEDLLFIVGYRESAVEEYGLDESFTGQYVPDHQTAFAIHFVISPEGQPTAYFIDFNKRYDFTDPFGRYTASKLESFLTPNSRNAVIQMCTDELLHNDFQQEEFDSNFGIFAQTDRYTLIEKGEPISLFNPTFGGSVETVTYRDFFGNEITEEVYFGSFVGFSSLEDDPETTSDFSSSITLEPGETSRLHIATDGYCNGSCGKGFMLLGLDDNYALWSPQSYEGADSGVIARIKENQVFDVVEKQLEFGDKIGTIELESIGFWAFYSEEGFYPSEILLVNSLPGDPVSINKSGELIVNNPEAFDYDVMPEMNLKLVHKSGNSQTAEVLVKIRVANSNVSGPGVVQAKDQFEVFAGESVNYSSSDLFSEDPDGDSISFSADGLPVGLVIEQVTGNITGSTDVVGGHIINVTASDGEYDVSAEVFLTVLNSIPEEEQSSGGGGALFWTLFVLLGIRLTRFK